jgi:alkylhydroperoxidase family enzyme
MSRLHAVGGNRFEDLLALAPGALEADTEMYQRLEAGISPRLYALIGVAVASSLGLYELVDAVKGGLDQATADEVTRDWRSAALTGPEKAVLSYAEKGTLDESSVRQKDVDALRDAGFSDADVLTIATTIAYHNYSLRVAAALGVSPRSMA